MNRQDIIELAGHREVPAWVFHLVGKCLEVQTNSNKVPLIRQWANERNLIHGSTPHHQMVKLAEEMGELAHSIARDNLNNAADAIGDMIVVLTIIAYQYGWQTERCIDMAWEQIKDRKGKMVDGVFIKEGD